MTFPLARLVDAPDPAATVRYDFNDEKAVAGRNVHADGFTLGAPSLLSAPDAVSPLYGDRLLSFRHEIRGSRADALAALAVLSRELLRSSNWFLFQLGGLDTRPTFWRLRATGPEALSFDRWYVDPPSGDPVPSRVSSNAFEVGVSLTAEAFGYGERITLGPYAVVQDSSGTNPMRVELPTIKGDAPTRVRVSVDPGEFDIARFGSEWLVAATSATGEIDDLVVGLVDEEVWIDVDAPAATDADYLSGGYHAISDGDVGAVMGTLPRLPQGRYLVMLRCAGFDCTDGFIVRLSQDPKGTAILPENFSVPLGVVAVPGRTGPFEGWLAMGTMSVPFGTAPPADVVALFTAPRLCVEVTTTAGSEVRLDALKLIPISGGDVTSATVLRSMTTAGVTIGQGQVGHWDGDTESHYVLGGGGVANLRSTQVGGYPVVDPAAETNTLFVMATDAGAIDNVDLGSVITTVGAESEVTVSYHPRLLHLDGRP